MNCLEHESKSCWEVYSSAKDRKAMDELAKRYVEFLTVCKTERETIAYVKKRLLEAKFKENTNGEFSGSACFKIFKGKTVFIARKGKRPLSEGFRLLGAHADTPRLDLKQRPIYEDCNVSQAKTHYYGGIRKHQWLARPLALHGVVAKTDGSVVEIRIGEEPDDPVFTIPDLLPHLAYKQMEQKLSDAFEAEKLNIIMGHAPSKEEIEAKKNNSKSCVKNQVLTLLNERFGISETDLYSAELQAVPAGPARFVGLDGSLIGGYGHDDRLCVFAGLEAILAAPKPEHAQIVLFWDKEEIGSEGATGARSRYFEHCLEDLVDAWEPGTRLSKIFHSSKAVSADVNAALDPDYQDVHEKMNACLLGHGPTFNKFTGHRGKVGASDAHFEYVAWIRGVMDKAGVPWQMAELGKVDLGGGGTVAKFLAEHCMDIIDFGPPVLSMHSPFELCSKADLYASLKAYQAFLLS